MNRVTLIFIATVLYFFLSLIFIGLLSFGSIVLGQCDNAPPWRSDRALGEHCLPVTPGAFDPISSTDRVPAPENLIIRIIE